MSLLQHVTQVGMHILAYILHRGLYGAVHQSYEVLLHTDTHSDKSSKAPPVTQTASFEPTTQTLAMLALKYQDLAF